MKIKFLTFKKNNKFLGLLKRNLFSRRELLIFIMFFLLTGFIILAKYSVNGDIQESWLPSTNKVVIIDAGHGLPDEGAVGFNATTEQAINLSISLKLQQLIEQSGAKVILTRSDENGIYSSDSNSIRKKKVSDIINRVLIGNSSEADMFISIHLNKYPDGVYRGWQTFYQDNNEKSKNLSQLIQENLGKNIEFKNGRSPLPLSGVYIMDNVKIPTVVVECGFLSNPNEAEMLKTDNYQNKLAWGIFIGIQDYFSKESEV